MSPNKVPAGLLGQAVVVHYIVDGMNVIGTRPDGWWRDRPAARRRLVEQVAPLAGDLGEVTVVFDGRSTTDETDRASDIGVRVAFAPGGPNAADDAILNMVGSLDAPEATVVVTSDRGLVDRVRRLGVKVESARTFLSRLEPSA